MTQHLHIVCSKVPWPVDCAFSADIFFTIESFYDCGINLHLHYFCEADEGVPNELNKYCKTIAVYKKDSVQDGSITALIKNLENSDWPVLVEGITDEMLIRYLDISHKKVVIRLHKPHPIRKQEDNLVAAILKKRFFLKGKRKDKEIFPSKHVFACTNKNDIVEYKKNWHLPTVVHIPTFISSTKIKCKEGAGDFCLYHGDLSIPENEIAATWLLRNVFNNLQIPFVIAGKNPSRKLDKLAHLCQHTCLISNPSRGELHDLITKAQINVLPSFGNEKPPPNVIDALFSGRHCITNDQAVQDSGVEYCCHIGNNANGIKSLIIQLYRQPFPDNEIELREKILPPLFDNTRSLKLLTSHLW